MPTAAERKSRVSKPASPPLGIPAVVWAIAGGAVVLRLIHAWLMVGDPLYDHPVIDPMESLARARYLAEVSWLGPPVAYWKPPLYDYFLGVHHALFGGGLWPARISQILLDGGSCILIFALARRLLSRRAGIAAAAVIGLWGPLIYFSSVHVSTSLVIFLELCVLLLAVRAQSEPSRVRWMDVGFALGLLATARAEALLLAPWLAGWLWLSLRRFARRERAEWVGMLAVGLVVILAPVSLRNALYARDPVLISANGGINLFIGTEPKYRGVIGVRPGPEWELLMRAPIDLGYYTEGERSQYYVRKARALIASDPGRWVAQLARKLGHVWHGRELPSNRDIYVSRSESFVLAWLLWSAPVLFFPVRLARAAGPRRHGDLVETAPQVAVSDRPRSGALRGNDAVFRDGSVPPRNAARARLVCSRSGLVGVRLCSRQAIARTRRRARAHLVLPEESIFAGASSEESSQAKASIVLTLFPGRTLAADEVMSVTHLVSSAVKGLRAERVSIIDSGGRMLSGGGQAGPSSARMNERQLEAKNVVESYLHDKLLGLLEPLVGEGRVRVQTTAVLDFTAVERTSETYDPDSQIPRTEERSSAVRPGPAARGVPGVESNIPGSVGTVVSAANEESSQASFRYEINRIVENIVEPIGQLQRLSVAVVVDDVEVVQESEGAAEEAPEGDADADAEEEPAEAVITFEPRDPEELRKITNLVKAAMGFNEERGDVLTVENIAFSPSASLSNLADDESYESREFWIRIMKYPVLAPGGAPGVFFDPASDGPVFQRCGQGAGRIRHASASHSGRGKCRGASTSTGHGAGGRSRGPEGTGARTRFQGAREGPAAPSLLGQRGRSELMAGRSEVSSGARKAALLMVMLGEEVAAGLVAGLAESELRALGREITRLGVVEASEAESTLREYHELLESSSDTVVGGVDFARHIVSRAKHDQAGPILGYLDEVQDAVRARAALEALPPKRCAQVLAQENPKTLAVVLAGMEPRAAAALLAELPEEAQGGVVERMSDTSELSPGVVGRVALSVHHKLEEMSCDEADDSDFDGLGSAAQIVKRMNAGRSKAVLESVAQGNPELAEQLRDLLFTFEDLRRVDSRGLAELLRKVDTKLLSVALKGATEDMMDLFLNNMSERAGDMLREEIECLGQTRLADIEAAQKEVVKTALELEQEGSITLQQEGGEESAGG